MKITPEKLDDYLKHREINSKDEYSRGCVEYSERWAALMEVAVSDGEAIEDCAKRTSLEADTEGITGFMYWAAVSILSQAWVFGEELRLWHNLEVQIKNEGEKANEEGGVLNPAILVIEDNPSN